MYLLCVELIDVEEGESVSAEDMETAAQSGEATPAASDDSLEAQLISARQQAGEYLEGWQRARAEFANYKKRVERELQENREMAMGIALKGLLPIIDDFDRALTNVPADIQEHPWVGGVSMVQRKFARMLEDNGVVIFDPLGEMFDPARHEAIGTDDDSDAPSGQVTATMQKGYTIGEHVLRPALVRVKR
jgi:molecular chaperone GrpE